MERRGFFKLFAGLAVGALPGRRLHAHPRSRIAVAGGGILGASIAYHLSKRGADVTLFERDRPASGTTGKSFAWINAHFSKQPLDCPEGALSGMANLALHDDQPKRPDFL